MCLGKAIYCSQDQVSKDVKLKNTEVLHGSALSEVQHLQFT